MRKIRRKVLTFTLASTIFFAGNGLSAEARTTHTVKSGESLWKISQQHKVSVSNLMNWNNLSSATIYVGQKLFTQAPSKKTSKTANYKVKSGDTLWSISNKNGTTVHSIKQLNNLKSNTIYVGQTLKLSVSKASSTANTYTVKAGDTLYSIAKQHGITVSKLKQMNHLSSNTIYVGQKLQLNSNTSNSSGNKTVQTNIVESIIKEGKKYIGFPYVWGGTSPSGFDCSGFLHYVFSKNGISIPRTVESIWNAGKHVSSPAVGDLVFFETYKKGPSHAGIYLGNGDFLHAGSSTGVTISNMNNNSYWTPKYLGAKRLH